MSDNDWVRAINNKNIYTGGQVRGGSVRADGRLSTGEVLQLDGVNTAGAGCSPNGLVSRDSAGAILSCQSGVWNAPKNNGRYAWVGSFTSQYNGYNSGSATITVYAVGGNSIVYKDLGDGQGCTNTWALSASAGGVGAASASDNNPAWSKSGTISFQVPANTSYSIVSNPLPSQGCSPGAFTVYAYE